MSSIKIVVSDLHLADGSFLDCFGANQQDAFAGLLHASSSHTGWPYQADTVELIINGDCFDFLVITPYTTQKLAKKAIALQKVEKIIAAHSPFFSVLRAFIAIPGRSITFLMGNHDLELCFEEVQARLCLAISGKLIDPRVYFCPTRFYRPLHDVYIEHGNHYDFWNHAVEDLWDQDGQALERTAETVPTSIGSWYFQRVTHQISTRYTYFDYFEPSINNTHQIALLCLFAPSMIIELAQQTMSMLSYPRQPHTNLAPGEEHNPVRLFEETMLDFVAFRDDMVARKGDWALETGSQQISPEEVETFLTIRDALALPPEEAVATICGFATYQMGEEVSKGMVSVLQRDPTLRYSIAGHTHMLRHDAINQGAQAYLNTACWTKRLAVPTADEVTPTLVQWLRDPDWNTLPLRNVTQYVFALIVAEPDEPTQAQLCVWEGGMDGRYRILATDQELGS